MTQSLYERNQLLIELTQTKEDMDQAFRQLNYAADPILVDSAIHQIEAAQLRYQYLLRQIRSLEPPDK